MQRTPPMISLRSLREAHGLTSKQLAERIAEQGLDVDPNSLLNVEVGRKKASKRLLTAWARALGVKPVDIRQHEDIFGSAPTTSTRRSA